MAKTKQKQNEAEELATVLGLLHKRVTVRGEEVTVEEFEIEQLPQLLTMIRDLTAKAQGESITNGLLMQSGEIGIRLAMLATGKPRDWFKKMPLGDGLALYAAIIEVNASFFGQIDQFSSLVALLGGVMNAGTGRDSSTPSLALVTPSTQSDDSNSVSSEPS